MLEALREAGLETHLVISRAVDMILKERRKLVLMVRKTPFHLGHLRIMTQLTEMGAIIARHCQLSMPSPNLLMR